MKDSCYKYSKSGCGKVIDEDAAGGLGKVVECLVSWHSLLVEDSSKLTQVVACEKC